MTMRSLRGGNQLSAFSVIVTPQVRWASVIYVKGVIVFPKLGTMWAQINSDPAASAAPNGARNSRSLSAPQVFAASARHSEQWAGQPDLE
jgi:hypothetical protein